MIFIDSKLSREEISKIKKDYIKITIDLENEWIIADTELHADAEKIFLDKGSKQDDIWGGGINFLNKFVDTTAVLNLRPRLKNDSIEILDPKRREKFVKITNKYFENLWH